MLVAALAYRWSEGYLLPVAFCCLRAIGNKEWNKKRNRLEPKRFCSVRLRGGMFELTMRKKSDANGLVAGSEARELTPRRTFEEGDKPHTKEAALPSGDCPWDPRLTIAAWQPSEGKPVIASTRGDGRNPPHNALRQTIAQVDIYGRHTHRHEERQLGVRSKQKLRKTILLGKAN